MSTTIGHVPALHEKLVSYIVRFCKRASDVTLKVRRLRSTVSEVGLSKSRDSEDDAYDIYLYTEGEDHVDHWATKSYDK